MWYRQMPPICRAVFRVKIEFAAPSGHFNSAESADGGIFVILDFVRLPLLPHSVGRFCHYNSPIVNLRNFIFVQIYTRSLYTNLVRHNATLSY